MTKMSKRCGTYSELTWLLMRHIPAIYKHYLDGELLSTYAWTGSAPFFYFSPKHEEVEARVDYSESSSIYSKKWKLQGVPPPYKEHFKNDVFVYDKPIVIVNNKYISEWNREPLNFINLDQLRMIFDMLKDKYQIIYIRALTNERGYWNDNQPAYDFRDYDMIDDEYPDVVLMSDLVEDHPELRYNDVQMMIHANADKFISIAGGNAVLSSYFGGENIIYRTPNINSDNRQIWHTDSHLSQLSGAKIVGVNSTDDLKTEVSKWL